MLGTIAIATAFVVGTVALAWASYFGMRAVVRSDVGSDSRDLAGSVIFRVSALHGLILALVFAQEMVGYQKLEIYSVDEATAVADVYNDIARYGTPARAEVQQALSDYVRVVANEEWSLLGTEKRLSAKGWELREKVYLTILDLDPATPRQTDLRRHMVDKVQTIAEMRQERENMALHPVSMMFWCAAVLGVVLVTIPYFIFAPTPLNVSLLGVYGAFTGVVMLFIYAFSNPYSPPGDVRPAAFERLLETEIGQPPRP